MKRKFFLGVLFFFIFCTAPIWAVNYVKNQIIIRTAQPLEINRLTASSTDPIFYKYKIKAMKLLQNGLNPFSIQSRNGQEAAQLNSVYTLTFADEIDVPAMIKEFSQSNQISWAQPNFIYHTYLTPDDTYYNKQWNIPLTSMNKAWDYNQGSKSIIVAVIDTGVDWKHEDLMGNIWLNTKEIPDNGIDDDKNGYVDDYRGWNFVSVEPPGKDPMDAAGHGTFVSGIIAGTINNAKGIAGISQSSIMALKAGDKDGSFETNEATEAILYAANNGANVLNLSWGAFSDPLLYDKILEEAVAYAIKKGCIVVASAGNESANIDTDPVIPACYTGVYAVSAVDNTGTFDSSYSNYGNRIDFSAPGTEVPSTYFDGTHKSYAYDSGTSFSAPHIAGLAALILSVNSNAKVYDAISKTATSKTGASKDMYYGYGIINGVKALAYAAPKAIRIIHTPVTTIDKKYDLIITANVTDVIYAEDTPSVSLYYAVDNAAWKSTSMKQTQTNVFSGSIASTELSGATFNYYIKASGLNVSNIVTAPDNAPTTYYSIFLEDLAGPVINSDIKANDYVNIKDKMAFSISDSSGVSQNSIELSLTAPDFSKTYNINSPEISFVSPKLTLDLSKVELKSGDGTFVLNAKDIYGNKANQFNLKVNLVSNPEDLVLTGTSASSPILNYPNPFDPNKESTKICYMVNKNTKTTILIYSLNYQCVKRWEITDSTGYHEVTWDGRDSANDKVPTGVYILVIKVTSDSKSVTKYTKIAVVY
ncbi:MAG: S8 family serine peptidase [Candidatus Margulisiibacteriota bacterium]|jgi:subtilisin family serine protease